MAKVKADSGADKPRSFEAIVERLEEIAKNLELGEIPLEQSLTLFEEGVALAKEGGRRLDEAEHKLEILREDDSVASFQTKGAAPKA